MHIEWAEGGVMAELGAAQGSDKIATADSDYSDSVTV